MRSLADRLLAMPATRHPMIEAARDALKLPDRNHVPIDGDHWRAACDRFVLPPDWSETLDAVFSDWISKCEAFRSGRAPLVPCWIEGRNFALHIFGSCAEPNCTIFTRALSGVGPLLTFVLSESNRSRFLSGGVFEYRTEAVIEELFNGLSEDQAGLFLRSYLVVAVCTLAALTSPRVTSVRRVLPSPVDRARAARARRRAQVGRPVWSHNLVEFVLPRTALHRGVVKPMESFAGMRGHSVVGHWRLIDGVLEPYWVWIDGHDRGNKALGKIVKSREVTLPADVHPKGFFRPDVIGHKGQRLPARRAEA